MKVLVTGGRDYRDKAHVFEVLDRIDFEHVIDELIEGGANGLDRLARMWAIKREVPYLTFEADWDDVESPGALAAVAKGGRIYNKFAGLKRNRDMLMEGRPDLVVGFPGGRGTHHMKCLAVQHGCTLLKV